MEILISHKYLTFPVNTKTVSKKICMYESGDLVYDLDVKLDMLHPDFTAYVDVQRFMGKTLTLGIDPEMIFEAGFADDMLLPEKSKEELRPQIHFTVANGWNNDPNGLIFLDGVYHMFFQYNPCSNEWGNMHWGHAVSTDLVHWEEKDIALFPDEFGTMYSGSAIADTENLLGLNQGNVPAMLLYYTAAGDRNLMSLKKNLKRTQCLAISTDSGKSFQKYEGNPVIQHIEAYNRDPKIVFVPELGKYLLALYMNEDRYRMLLSTDLIHFETLCELSLAGETECPDFFPLECEGKKYWVLTGASDFYVAGHFEGNVFVYDSPVKKLTANRISYAAQCFSGIEDGRVIKIAWEKLRIPANNISGQMSVPVSMKLEKTDGEFYLSALPVKEIDMLRAKRSVKENFTLNERIRFDCAASPLDINLEAAYTENAVISLFVFGHKIVLDMKNNTVCVDGTKDNTMRLSVGKKKTDLRLLVDRCSVELFADGGKSVIVAPFVCDFNLPYVELSSSCECSIDRFECFEMKSIYD